MSKNNTFSGTLKIKEIIKKPNARVHFTGVGGVGMYSLFRLSEARGIICTGSDRAATPLFSDLAARGARVGRGSALSFVENADLLVYTLAVSEDDPEILRAEQMGIDTVSRAEYLSALSEDYHFKIGVSGSHGKSTVTAMLAEIFKHAGRNPTVVSGASLSRDGSPLHIGDNSSFIYEACEYKDSFLCFSPNLSVFTNLELDHVDYFKDLDSIKRSFARAIDLSSSAVINLDDENLRSLIPTAKKKIITSSLLNDADFRGKITGQSGGCYSFELSSESYGSAAVTLKIPGRFNVSNSLSAIAAAVECGISLQCAAEALSGFFGIDRRLQSLGKYKGSNLYYDYAHHPTEIKAGIEAVREIVRGPVTVIFRPHTYSRTAGLWGDFATALSLADRVIILDIDPIREEKIDGISSEELARNIGDKAVYSRENDVIPHLYATDSGGIIIMGAADLGSVLSSFKNNT